MTKVRSLKVRGEDAAAAFLERVGIAVIERRWACDMGRIDAIAWDADTLVFVDVVTRSAERSEAIPLTSTATMRRVSRIARTYLDSVGLDDISWRYDRIDLIVVSEDSALLRHHRAVGGHDK